MDKENKDTTSQKPIAKGKVYVPKESKLHKIYSIFFSASPSDVIKGLIMNVLIPDAKYTLNNMWKKSGDMLMYGVDESRKGGSRRRRRDDHYDYSDQYRNGSGNGSRSQSHNSSRIIAGSSRADYWKTIEFERKGDAEDIIDYLRDELEEYDYVRVDTLLEQVKMLYPGLNLDIEPIHTKWGWDDLDDARVEIGRGGRWRLVMPKMIPID